MYVSIRIDESAAEILNRKCAELGLTKSQVVVRGCDALGKTEADDADALLEKLDKQYDNPPIDPIAMGLRPGELPECCQLIYQDPEDPTPQCAHWEKAWVNYYGRKVLHYRNKLTGLSYFDYFNKYMGA